MRCALSNGYGTSYLNSLTARNWPRWWLSESGTSRPTPLVVWTSKPFYPDPSTLCKARQGCPNVLDILTCHIMKSTRLCTVTCSPPPPLLSSSPPPGGGGSLGTALLKSRLVGKHGLASIHSSRCPPCPKTISQTSSEFSSVSHC